MQLRIRANNEIKQKPITYQLRSQSTLNSIHLYKSYHTKKFPFMSMTPLTVDLHYKEKNNIYTHTYIYFIYSKLHGTIIRMNP